MNLLRFLCARFTVWCDSTIVAADPIGRAISTRRIYVPSQSLCGYPTESPQFIQELPDSLQLFVFPTVAAVIVLRFDLATIAFQHDHAAFIIGVNDLELKPFRSVLRLVEQVVTDPV